MKLVGGNNEVGRRTSTFKFPKSVKELISRGCNGKKLPMVNEYLKYYIIKGILNMELCRGYEWRRPKVIDTLYFRSYYQRPDVKEVQSVRWAITLEDEKSGEAVCYFHNDNRSSGVAIYRDIDSYDTHLEKGLIPAKHIQFEGEVLIDYFIEHCENDKGFEEEIESAIDFIKTCSEPLSKYCHTNKKLVRIDI